jgi:fatty acid amide hydrolase 2
VVNHFEDKYKVQVTRLRLNRLRYAVSLWSSMMVDGQLSSRDFGLILYSNSSYINGYRELLNKFLFRSTHTLPAIGLLILEALPNKYNKRFHKIAHKFFDEIQVLLGDNGVLLFPTFPQSAPYHGWPIIQNTVDYIYCGIINALGLPSTQCPLGLNSQQLPLGIQCIAARGHDQLTLAVAQEIEQAMGGWVSPSRII